MSIRPTKPGPAEGEVCEPHIILPFHFGSARSSHVFGSSAGFTIVVLIPTVLTKEFVATQNPSGSTNSFGQLAVKSGSHFIARPSRFSGGVVPVPSNTSDRLLPALASFRMRSTTSEELARTYCTLTPYFFSKAATSGVTTCGIVCTVYQTI